MGGFPRWLLRRAAVQPVLSALTALFSVNDEANGAMVYRKMLAIMMRPFMTILMSKKRCRSSFHPCGGHLGA